MDKQALRKEIRDKKRAMTEAEIVAASQRLAELFVASEAYRQAKTIYGYLPYNQEVRTQPIIRRAWADGKRVAVPRVLSKGVMEFYYIDSFDGFIRSSFGVPEPPEDPAKLADESDFLLLMPGLAFDRAHNRVGYGGGFYDRYIERKQRAGARIFKPALAYDFQIVDSIPANDFDVRVDAVLTENGII